MRFDILAKLDYKRCHFESCPTNWRLACHASFSTSLDDTFWNKIPSGIIGHRNEVYPPFFQFIDNLTCYFKINLSISWCGTARYGFDPQTKNIYVLQLSPLRALKLLTKRTLSTIYSPLPAF